MPDPADVAQYQAEQMEKLAGVGHRKIHDVRLHPKGQCYNCDEPVGKLMLYCDEECEVDWRKRREARGRR